MLDVVGKKNYGGATQYWGMLS